MLSVGNVVVFKRFVAIFGKIHGSFSPKIVGRFFSQNPCSTILRPKKKVPMAIKPAGGDYGLNGLAISVELFLRLPLYSKTLYIYINYFFCKLGVSKV